MSRGRNGGRASASWFFWFCQRAFAAAVQPVLSEIYQNQLIQQTESELIAQSAALAAVFKREIETAVPESVALGKRSA